MYKTTIYVQIVKILCVISMVWSLYKYQISSPELYSETPYYFRRSERKEAIPVNSTVPASRTTRGLREGSAGPGGNDNFFINFSPAGGWNSQSFIVGRKPREQPFSIDQ